MFSIQFKKAAKITAPAMLLGLAACATPFQANVSRFQQLPPAQGQTFTIVAEDPANAGGIEFGEYANIVASEMVRQGYRPAASPAAADLVVSFGYGVDDGREKIVSDYSPFGRAGFYDPFWGPRFGRGFYGRRFIYGWNDPFIYGGGLGFGGPDIRSYTVYTGEIDLKIDRAGTGERLFEGRAQSHSRTDNLTYLVPNLVEAMFTGFPGNSGETVRISVAPPSRS